MEPLARRKQLDITAGGSNGSYSCCLSPGVRSHASADPSENTEQKMTLPKGGKGEGFQSGATMDGSASNTGTPTHSASRGVTPRPAYFTTRIKWQFRQSWVGLPVSGLLIKLITMVTGRERSRLPTPIFSHNSFNGFQSLRREAPFRYRAAAISLPSIQSSSNLPATQAAH